MDLAAFKALLSPVGQDALRAAQALQPQESDFLQHFEALRRWFPDNLARAALETAILRQEAEIKFPFADRMYFTRQALEQSSSYAVSSYRSKRFLGCSRVADLGCSIGGDTLALAEITPVIGLDLDSTRLAMAAANLQALELQERCRFLQSDLNSPLPLRHSPFLGIFFDPARRTRQQRVFSVRDYQPPLAAVKNWLPGCPAVGVKISPGVKLQELSEYDAEVEFISLKGELKEAVLWFGPLKTAERRATILPGAHTLIADKPALEPRLAVREPGAYLYEPDPAILRAGLVQQLGEQLGAAQIDAEIAYLTSDHSVITPFARVWAVEDWFPFQLKRLRAVLRQRGINQVVVKKRGSPLQPEQLIQKLRLKAEKGTNRVERVIVLTQLRGRPIVVICLPDS